MIKRFFCIFLCFLLGVNVCRIGFNPSFWSASESEKMAILINSDACLEVLNTFSDDMYTLYSDCNYLRVRFINAWNQGFLNGVLKFFTNTFPDMLRISIDILNLFLGSVNLVLALVGLPTFGSIPVWNRDEPRVYPPGSGGGGGSR